jgi:hypothetical protein
MQRLEEERATTSTIRIRLLPAPITIPPGASSFRALVYSIVVRGNIHKRHVAMRVCFVEKCRDIAGEARHDKTSAYIDAVGGSRRRARIEAFDSAAPLHWVQPRRADVLAPCAIFRCAE